MSETPIRQLTEMSPRGRAALQTAGIATAEEACANTDEHLLSLFGFAKGSLDRLREWEKSQVVIDATAAYAHTENAVDGLLSPSPGPGGTTWYPSPVGYIRNSDGEWRDRLISMALDIAEILVKEHKRTAPQSMDDAFSIAARCYRNIDMLEAFFEEGPDATNPFVQRRNPDPDGIRPAVRFREDAQPRRRIVAGHENLMAAPPVHATRQAREAIPILKPAPSADLDANDTDWDDSEHGDFSDQDY